MFLNFSNAHSPHLDGESVGPAGINLDEVALFSVNIGGPEPWGVAFKFDVSNIDDRDVWVEKETEDTAKFLQTIRPQGYFKYKSMPTADLYLNLDKIHYWKRVGDTIYAKMLFTSTSFSGAVEADEFVSYMEAKSR
jgi:hypothetical protein